MGEVTVKRAAKKKAAVPGWIHRVSFFIYIYTLFLFDFRAYLCNISSGMLKNFGNWLGLASPMASQPPGDTEELIAEKEEKVVEAQNEVNKPQPTDTEGETATKQDADHQAKGLSGKINKYFVQIFTVQTVCLPGNVALHHRFSCVIRRKIHEVLLN